MLTDYHRCTVVVVLQFLLDDVIFFFNNGYIIVVILILMSSLTLSFAFQCSGVLSECGEHKFLRHTYDTSAKAAQSHQPNSK